MKKIMYTAILVVTVLLGACTTNDQYTPQQILENTMQQSTDVTSYYAEYVTNLGDESDIQARHWLQDGKVRVEMTDSDGQSTTVLNDGDVLYMLDAAQKEVTALKLDEASGEFIQPTLKEQLTNMYDMIKDTHDISYGEDEKIAGYDTYHLIATPREKNTLFGKMEFWIDKKTWMPLKSITVSGDLLSTVEYTKYEPNIDIDAKHFEFELPQGYTLTEKQFELPPEITLQQANDLLGELLILPEKTGYTISVIQDMQTDSNEVSISYTKDDIQQFSISAFIPEEPLQITTPITVRGIQGSSEDLGFPFFQWEEQGIRYNVMIENDALSIDEVVTLLEQMELYS